MSLTTVTAFIRPIPGFGSVDAARDAFEAQTRPVLEVLTPPEYGGTESPVESLNRALAGARGDWLAVVEADTLVAPDWCGRLEAVLRERPGLSGVSGRTVEAPGPLPADAWRSRHLPRHWGDAPRESPPFPRGAALYRRAHVLEAGGWTQAPEEGGDEDLAKRLYARERGLFYEPRAQALGRLHDTPASALERAWRRFKGDAEQGGLYRHASRYREYLPFLGSQVLRHIRQDRQAGVPWEVLRLSLGLLPYLLVRDLEFLALNKALDQDPARESALGLASLVRSVWGRLGLKDAPGAGLWPESEREAPAFTGDLDEAGFKALQAVLPLGHAGIWLGFVKAWTECLEAALKP